MPPLPPVTRATRPSRGCSAPTRRSHDLHLARCCCAEVMDRAHHCCPLGGAARRPGGLVRVDDREVVHARHLEAHQAYNTTASSLASPPLEREWWVSSTSLTRWRSKRASARGCPRSPLDSTSAT